MIGLDIDLGFVGAEVVKLPCTCLCQLIKGVESIFKTLDRLRDVHLDAFSNIVGGRDAQGIYRSVKDGLSSVSKVSPARVSVGVGRIHNRLHVSEEAGSVDGDVSFESGGERVAPLTAAAVIGLKYATASLVEAASFFDDEAVGTKGDPQDLVPVFSEFVGDNLNGASRRVIVTGVFGVCGRVCISQGSEEKAGNVSTGGGVLVGVYHILVGLITRLCSIIEGQA